VGANKFDIAMPSPGHDSHVAVLHRQVLDMENALRTRTSELQEVSKYRKHAEEKYRALKASHEHEAVETRGALQNFRRLVHSQESTINSLKLQLAKEREHRQRLQNTNPKCPLVGDPDWPKELNERYVAERVPIGARTFAVTLLQHVRVVQSSKEGQLDSLRATTAELRESLEQERHRADANAKLAARLHREVERLSGQVPHSDGVAAKQVRPVTSSQHFQLDAQTQHAWSAAPPSAEISAAEEEIERTTERIKSMFSPQRWLQTDTVASPSEWSPISVTLESPNNTFSLDSPGTPTLRPHLSFSPIESSSEYSPQTSGLGYGGTAAEPSHVVGSASNGAYSQFDSCCACKQDGPPLF